MCCKRPVSLHASVLLLLLPLLYTPYATGLALQKFLVVGGTGRVGGSTAKYLHQLSDTRVELVLGGRSVESFTRSKSRILQQLREDGQSVSPPVITFQPLDIDKNDVEELTAAIKACGADCIVHTAGPFQQRTRPVLLEASIHAGLPYVDVCDEPLLCAASKKQHEKAVAAGTIGWCKQIPR